MIAVFVCKRVIVTRMYVNFKLVMHIYDEYYYVGAREAHTESYRRCVKMMEYLILERALKSRICSIMMMNIATWMQEMHSNWSSR